MFNGRALVCVDMVICAQIQPARAGKDKTSVFLIYQTNVYHSYANSLGISSPELCSMIYPSTDTPPLKAGRGSESQLESQRWKYIGDSLLSFVSIIAPQIAFHCI